MNTATAINAPSGQMWLGKDFLLVRGNVAIRKVKCGQVDQIGG